MRADKPDDYSYCIFLTLQLPMLELRGGDELVFQFKGQKHWKGGEVLGCVTTQQQWQALHKLHRPDFNVSKVSSMLHENSRYITCLASRKSTCKDMGGPCICITVNSASESSLYMLRRILVLSCGQTGMTSMAQSLTVTPRGHCLLQRPMAKPVLRVRETTAIS